MKFQRIDPDRFPDPRFQISATRELNRRVKVLPEEEEACVHAKQSAQNACTMMRLQGTANSLSLSLSHTSLSHTYPFSFFFFFSSIKVKFKS